MAVIDAGTLTCAEVIAQELARVGVERVFGFPGGEILDLVKACGQEGIEFILTRDEATAAFLADATGQLQGIPGVCMSTLGPGAMNLALGVANAYLDRSPVIAITAATAAAANKYATHQNLDLNAIYRPFTKLSLTLDGENTAETVRRALALATDRRPGPVHIALPSDVARAPDRATEDDATALLTSADRAAPSGESVKRIASEIRAAQRPVVLLGFDLDPQRDLTVTRRLVERIGAPVFVTPKAKGMLPEDHALFFGVCAGVAADNLVVDFFKRSDLLIGIGFDPVESNKLWHKTRRLVSLSPASIAVDEYRPAAECVGDVNETIPMLLERDLGSSNWPNS